ncbi:hypothetical protein [Streptomyces hokutonensis]|uniref:hypothetical protein n=1 Tax=Streptomyces hokutonensis TaxID=1306990 RepID=UPI0033F960CF
MTQRRRGNAAPSRRHSRTRRITPRSHWLLLSVLAVTLSTALLLQGYTHHMFGIASDDATGARGHDGAVPSQVVHGGPVIANAATTPHTAHVKARTIALTFDDGPDPVSGSRLRWQRMERYGSLRVPAGAEVPGTDFPRQDPGLPQQYSYETQQLY